MKMPAVASTYNFSLLFPALEPLSGVVVVVSCYWVVALSILGCVRITILYTWRQCSIWDFWFEKKLRCVSTEQSRGGLGTSSPGKFLNFMLPEMQSSAI